MATCGQYNLIYNHQPHITHVAITISAACISFITLISVLSCSQTPMNAPTNAPANNGRALPMSTYSHNWMAPAAEITTMANSEMLTVRR